MKNDTFIETSTVNLNYDYLCEESNVHFDFFNGKSFSNYNEKYPFIYYVSLRNDDISIGIFETEGIYLYGKYYKLENDIYAYYGDVLDYEKVPWEFYTIPKTYDETILSYFKIEDDILYPLDSNKQKLDFFCKLNTVY